MTTEHPPHSQKSPPAFSVLLSFYHRSDPQQLLAAVHSIAHSQTLPPHQIVLVQDGPVPATLTNTVTQLRDQLTIRLDHITIDHNVGLGPALNLGLNHCQHDIVARMDCDDLSLPERFEQQMPLILQGFHVVGTGILEYDDQHTDNTAVRTPITNPDDVATQMRLQQTVNHPTVMYRKSAVQACGGYPDFPHMEDYLLFARMAQAQTPMTNIPTPLVKYRVSDGAYARRGGWLMLKTEVALQRKFLNSGFTTPAQCGRNLLVRGAYRLIPEQLRKHLYRTLLATRGKRFNQR